MPMTNERKESDGGVLHDRRRPGRQDVHPSLIPLLRGQGPAIADDAANFASGSQIAVRDDLASAVGIGRGVLGMCAVWAVGLVAYVLV